MVNNKYTYKSQYRKIENINYGCSQLQYPPIQKPISLKSLIKTQITVSSKNYIVMLLWHNLILACLDLF